MVTLLSALPVPSSSFAARIRTVWSCDDSATGAINTARRADRKAVPGMSSSGRCGAHYNPLTRAMLKPAFAALLVAVATVNVAPASPEQDWPFYGGDQGGTKFSPLTDVNTSTAGRLGVAWQWAPREKALEEFGTRPGN